MLPFHVVDVQALKRDMAHRCAVLRDAGHAGAVHAVGRAVELGAIRIGRVGPLPRVDRVVDVGVVIGDLQVLHRDVRHVLSRMAEETVPLFWWLPTDAR